MAATVLNPRQIMPNGTSSADGGVTPHLLRSIALGCKFGLVTISLLAGIVSLSQTPPSSALGTIHGVVLDSTGEPLPDADVYVITDSHTSRLNYVSTVSDAEGIFVLNALPLGSYYLHANKVSAGYPDDFWSFSATDPPRLMVNVEAGKTTKAVIQKGPKCASLKLSVTDEKAMPRTDYTLEFNRIDLGETGVFRTTPEFPHGPQDPPMGPDWPRGLKPLPILVPPFPFRLTVHAEGYEPWHYGGANYTGKTGLLILKSGQTLALDVRLRRTKIGGLYDQLIQPSETNSAAAEFANLDHTLHIW
jgi:hypothetical protein